MSSDFPYYLPIVQPRDRKCFCCSNCTNFWTKKCVKCQIFGLTFGSNTDIVRSSGRQSVLNIEFRYKQMIWIWSLYPDTVNDRTIERIRKLCKRFLMYCRFRVHSFLHRELLKSVPRCFLFAFRKSGFLSSVSRRPVSLQIDRKCRTHNGTSTIKIW